MTVGQLLGAISSMEITEWAAFFEAEEFDRKMAAEGGG